MHQNTIKFSPCFSLGEYSWQKLANICGITCCGNYFFYVKKENYVWGLIEKSTL